MSNEERPLSPAEQRRKIRYEAVCAEMKKNGYQQRDLTIGVLSANIGAVAVTMPLILLAGWMYITVHPANEVRFTLPSIGLFLALFLLAILLHEWIHGLTWGLFAKSHLRAISFGVIWQALTPYCTCSEPLTRGQYLLGGIMPTLILGILPAVFAILAGSLPLFLFSELMILGGGGDLLIIGKLLLYRSRGKEVLYYDHPYACGLTAFERNQ